MALQISHPSVDVIRKVLSSCNQKSDWNELTFCQSCAMTKHHKLPFPLSNLRASPSFQLIHKDLWGPSPIKAVTGETRYTWIYFLNDKSQAIITFTQFNTTIKIR